MLFSKIGEFFHYGKENTNFATCETTIKKITFHQHKNKSKAAFYPISHSMYCKLFANGCF